MYREQLFCAHERSLNSVVAVRHGAAFVAPGT